MARRVLTGVRADARVSTVTVLRIDGDTRTVRVGYYAVESSVALIAACEAVAGGQQLLLRGVIVRVTASELQVLRSEQLQVRPQRIQHVHCARHGWRMVARSIRARVGDVVNARRFGVEGWRGRHVRGHACELDATVDVVRVAIIDAQRTGVLEGELTAPSRAAPALQLVGRIALREAADLVGSGHSVVADGQRGVQGAMVERARAAPGTRVPVAAGRSGAAVLLPETRRSARVECVHIGWRLLGGRQRGVRRQASHLRRRRCQWLAERARRARVADPDLARRGGRVRKLVSAVLASVVCRLVRHAPLAEHARVDGHLRVRRLRERAPAVTAGRRDRDAHLLAQVAVDVVNRTGGVWHEPLAARCALGGVGARFQPILHLICPRHRQDWRHFIVEDHGERQLLGLVAGGVGRIVLEQVLRALRVRQRRRGRRRAKMAVFIHQIDGCGHRERAIVVVERSGRGHRARRRVRRASRAVRHHAAVLPLHQPMQAGQAQANDRRKLPRDRRRGSDR